MVVSFNRKTSKKFSPKIYNSLVNNLVVYGTRYRLRAFTTTEGPKQENTESIAIVIRDRETQGDCTAELTPE